MNNEKIFRVFVSSKNGNADSQKEILNYLENLVHPLTMVYYHNTKKMGITLEDLHDLVTELLFYLYENIDSSVIYDFDNLAKYYYIKLVQKEVRDSLRKKRSYFLNAKSLDGQINNGDLVFSRTVDAFDSGDLREVIMDDEIFEKSVIQNGAKLSEREKIILVRFLNNYTVKEISKELHVHYQTTYKHLTIALDKIRNFIQCVFPEIYARYAKH
jgi:RNA polymerase sigma factor (sigma-70 family)